MLEGLRRLNVYLVDMMAAKRDTYTLTHQAYAASLQSILIEFSVTLADFERRLTQQKVSKTEPDHLFSTTSVSITFLGFILLYSHTFRVRKDPHYLYFFSLISRRNFPLLGT